MRDATDRSLRTAVLVARRLLAAIGRPVARRARRWRRSRACRRRWPPSRRSASATTSTCRSRCRRPNVRRPEAGRHRRDRGLRGHSATRSPRPEKQREVATSDRDACRCGRSCRRRRRRRTASPPPPLPLPPGVDRGATAVVRETLTPEPRVAVELPVERRIRGRGEPTDDTEAPSVPSSRRPPTALPRRHYFVVGVSPRGRESAPSTPSRSRSRPAAPRRARRRRLHRERDDHRVDAVARRAHVDVPAAADRQADAGANARRRTPRRACRRRCPRSRLASTASRRRITSMRPSTPCTAMPRAERRSLCASSCRRR